MFLFTPIGLTLTTLACLCLYAASPHQKLWKASWPLTPALVASAVLLVLGWLALAQDMQRLAASLAFVTTLMLALVVLPYIGAFFHARRTH